MPILEHCKVRHHQAMTRLRAHAENIVPKDQRYVIMVYDGPESVIRELSWTIQDGTAEDMKTICEAVADQIRQGGRHVAGKVAKP